MFTRVTEPTLLADGVVRLGTELVNWYLLEDGGRVTIVDAGAPSYRPQLERGLALLGHLVTAGMPKKLAIVTTFGDGETLDVPGRPRVLHTPGHTAGHVCFWLESQGVLIAGDLLCSRNPLTGARGPQLMPSPFNASNAELLDSLAKIEQLAAETIVFGHGEPWTGGAAEAVRLARATGPT
ncbi:MAG: MBL fold metallo-hydrolase [Gaiellaceae bacterium]|jgi:glyoxylase-like metal-dependent hydrolase (beta-lactamase superfamily II)